MPVRNPKKPKKPKKPKTAIYIVALIAVALFGAGLVKLLLLRFEAGDVYPLYSSLRSDPMGTKAIYQSLDRLDRLSVRRNYRPLAKLTDGRGRTMFYLGATPRTVAAPSIVQVQPAAVRESPLEKLPEFVSTGGRLVISFSGVYRGEGIPDDVAYMMARFGFSVEVGGKDEDESTPAADAVARPTAHAPDRAADVPWRSKIHLGRLDDNWRAIYRRDGKPVIAERSMGKGSVVVAADSYFLSNEAMRNAPRPRLLAWLIGSGQVIFDETHLGVQRSAGIATLAREYHLAALLGVLVLVGGLFVWKNAASFLPREAALAEALSGASVAGKGSATALVNLLRKAMGRTKIVSICLKEWKRSVGPHRPDGPRRAARAQTVVEQHAARPAKKRDPVAAYRAVARILSERK